MNSLPERALRIGILSTANIARQFIDGVRSSRKIAVTAVASRDADKARAFARATGVAAGASDL